MNRHLTQDALLLLQAELSPIAGIQLSFEAEEGDRLLAVLDGFEMDARRRVCLAGLYIILTEAARSHMKCNHDDQDLVRHVLDGDYLYSFYLQFAIQHRELDLVAFLAPYVKRQQIARSCGQDGETDYARLIGQYLVKEFKKSGRPAKAIEQVG